MRRLFVILPMIIILILAVALIGPSFVDWKMYKTQIQDQVKAQTELDLALNGDLSLVLLPYPRLIAEDINVNTMQKSKYDTLLSLKRLEVGLALLPLLKGQISVNSLTLIEPKINIEILPDGKMNFMTSKLDARMSGGERTSSPAPASSSSTLPSISFDNIQIKDGQFALYDQAKKQETLLEAVTGDITAKSLTGPFTGKGTMMYQGRIVNFDAAADMYNPDTKVMSTKIGLTLQPGNIKAKYAGALGFADGFSAQGQMELQIDDLAKTMVANNMGSDQAFLEGRFEAKGFMSADAKKIVLKDFEAGVADQKIQGQLETVLEPLSIKANLKTTSDIDLQKFVAGYPGLKKGSFDVDLTGDQEAVRISKAMVRINDAPYDLSGAYIFINKTGRPELNFNIAAKTLDADIFKSIEPKKNNVETNTNKENLKKNSAPLFPMDITFSASADSLIYEKEKFSNVKAKGALVQNSLKIGALSFQGFKSSDGALSGEIRDIQSLNGVSLVGSITTKDARGLVSYFGLDASQIPPEANTGSLKFKVSGQKNLMDATVNITAANGEMIAQTRVKEPLSKPVVDNLTVQIKHKNMAEALQIFAKLPQKSAAFSKPLDFYAHVKLQDDGSYVLSDIKGDLSGIIVQGNANLLFDDSKPTIKGNLQFEDLNLNGLSSGSMTGQKASASVTPSSSAKNAGSRWSKEPIDLSGLNALNVDLNIKAKRFSYDPWVITAPEMTITLDDGNLNIKDVKGGLFGGQIALSSTVETAPQPRQPIHVAATSKLDNVDVSMLLKALTGSELVKATGRVNGDLNIKTSGLSTAALVYDLSGKSNVSGADIVLEGVDVERFAQALSEESKPGDSAMGIWKGVSKGGNTTFDTLVGAFDITEGIVNIQKLDLDGKQASIFTTGKIDLPNWTLATKHKLTAKTRPDVPPFEMAFSGSLDNPAQTFGQGLLNDYLQRKLQRKLDKVLGDKLGLPFGKNTPAQNPNDITPANGDAPQTQDEPTQEAPAQQPAPQKLKDMKPEDAMKDILKGILQ